jgi:hypothetical protein
VRLVLLANKGKWAKVDDEDFDFVNRFHWSAKELRADRWYAVRNESGKHIYMHRFIVEQYQVIPPGHVVNHIDNEGLNNQRRENLEVVLGKENTRHYHETKSVAAYLSAHIYNLAREKMRQKARRPRRVEKRIRAP